QAQLFLPALGNRRHTPLGERRAGLERPGADLQMNEYESILSRLADTLETRLPSGSAHMPSESYVAKLYQKGPDAFLKKVGEEATELVMAAKDADAPRIIAETADLWFHSMVALAYYGVRPEQVLDELARREGVSGLAEKASRPQS